MKTCNLRCTFLLIVLLYVHVVSSTKETPAILSYGPPFSNDTTGFETIVPGQDNKAHSKGFASITGSTNLIYGMKLSSSSTSYIYGDLSQYNGEYIGGFLQYNLQTGTFSNLAGKGVIGIITDVLVLNGGTQVAFIGGFESFVQSPGVTVQGVAACNLDLTNCFQIGNGIDGIYLPVGTNYVFPRLIQIDNYLYAEYATREVYCYVQRFNLDDMSGNWEILAKVSGYCTFDMAVMLNKLHLIGSYFGDLVYSNPYQLTTFGVMQWNGTGWTAVGDNPGTTDYNDLYITYGSDYAFYNHNEYGYGSVVSYWNATGEYWLPLYYWSCVPYPEDFKIAPLNSTAAIVYCYGYFYQMNVGNPSPSVDLLNVTCVDYTPHFQVVDNILYVLCEGATEDEATMTAFDLQQNKIISVSQVLTNLASLVVYVDTMCEYGDRIFLFDADYNSVGSQTGFSGSGAIWDDSFGKWTPVRLPDPTGGWDCRCTSDGDNLAVICLDYYRFVFITDENSDFSNDNDLKDGTPADIIQRNLTTSNTPSNLVKYGDDYYFAAFIGFQNSSFDNPQSYVFKWDSEKQNVSEFLGPIPSQQIYSVVVFNDTMYLGLFGFNFTMDSQNYSGVMKYDMVAQTWMPIEGVMYPTEVSLVWSGVASIVAVDQAVYLCGRFDQTTSGHFVQNFYQVDSQGNFVGDLSGGFTQYDYGACHQLTLVDDILYFAFANPTCINSLTCEAMNAYNLTSGYYSSNVRPFVGTLTNSLEKEGNGKDNSSGNTVAIAVGVSVAGLAVIAAAVGIVAYLFTKKRKQFNQEAELETRNSDRHNPTLFDNIDFQAEEILLKDVLGKGSFGTVWGCVLPNRNNASYAVKQILVSKADTTVHKKLEKEINELLKIRHPHVVHSVGYKKSVSPTVVEFFIFMELFEKPFSLRGVMNKKMKRYEKSTNPNKQMEWFTASEIKLFMQQISDGLHFLHDKGIAHRDLKCANILVRTRTATSVRSCHITDFGLSTFVAEQEPSTGLGTLGFLAPEVSATTPYDAFKADIWAFGMIIYELISFKEPSQSGVVPDFPPEREITSTKNAAFETVLQVFQKCTEKDPKDRPNSSELLELCRSL